MSGLQRKLEGEIEIRAGGGDFFHEIVANRPHHVSIIHPELVQGCDLHEGDFGKPGSIISWSYTLDGKCRTQKQIIEVIEEEKKVIKLKVIEGDLLKEYKNFVVILQVIPKDEKNSIFKWIFEYEKFNLGEPEPTSFMDAMIGLTKHIDEHHHLNECNEVK